MGRGPAFKLIFNSCFFFDQKPNKKIKTKRKIRRRKKMTMFLCQIYEQIYEQIHDNKCLLLWWCPRFDDEHLGSEQLFILAQTFWEETCEMSNLRHCQLFHRCFFSFLPFFWKWIVMHFFSLHFRIEYMQSVGDILVIVCLLWWIFIEFSLIHKAAKILHRMKIKKFMLSCSLSQLSFILSRATCWPLNGIRLNILDMNKRALYVTYIIYWKYYCSYLSYVTVNDQRLRIGLQYRERERLIRCCWFRSKMKWF